MRIGILGSGDVAKSLARGFAGRSDEVRLGTRSGTKADLEAWIRESGLAIRQANLREATAWAEVVVLSMRGMSNDETLATAGPENFRGKIVIDTTNPLVFAPNGPPQLGISGADSAGERVQRTLPDAKVVKAFNTIGHLHMVHPTFPHPPTMFLCGNDGPAKGWVGQLLRDFGWSSVVDVGGIEGSRQLESLCVLWVTLGLRLEDWNIAFRLERRAAPGDGAASTGVK